MLKNSLNLLIANITISIVALSFVWLKYDELLEIVEASPSTYAGVISDKIKSDIELTRHEVEKAMKEGRTTVSANILDIGKKVTEIYQKVDNPRPDFVNSQSEMSQSSPQLTEIRDTLIQLKDRVDGEYRKFTNQEKALAKIKKELSEKNENLKTEIQANNNMQQEIELLSKEISVQKQSIEMERNNSKNHLNTLRKICSYIKTDAIEIRSAAAQYYTEFLNNIEKMEYCPDEV